MKSLIKHLLVGLLFSFCISKRVVASDIKEVLPLTSKVIMVHFDDGSVTYPNSLSVSRLVAADADNIAKWSFTSTDDTEFLRVVNPT